MSKTQLLPEFANVAFNLKDPKRVSQIVQTEYGYHIIQLIEKRGDRINCRHILLKPKVSDKELADATTRLDSLYNDLQANMQELPQEIGKVVYDMKVGEISKPFTMLTNKQKEVVAIVKLKARTEGHKANLADDFQALKAIVEAKKREELLNDWITKKQKSTYVRISDGWRNCDFKYPGWIKE